MRWVWLWAIFGIVLATRLFFAFQTPYLSTDEAYLHYRLVSNILETGFPLLTDTLSWGGSFIDISPLFAYILAGFSFILGKTLALKLIPNVFASLLVFPVFGIAFRITRRYGVSLLAAFVASFVPVFFANTFNQVSVSTIIVPLFFWLVLLWMDSNVPFFVAGIVFFAFLNPSSLILILGLLLFVVLCTVERLKVSVADFEVLLFSTGFAVWAQFILYKQALFSHGLSVFWLNIPSPLLSASFSQLSFFDVLWQVGFFPLVAGIYVIYRTVVRVRDRNLYLFFCILLSVFVLLWFQLIELLY